MRLVLVTASIMNCVRPNKVQIGGVPLKFRSSEVQKFRNFTHQNYGYQVLGRHLTHERPSGRSALPPGVIPIRAWLLSFDGGNFHFCALRRRTATGRVAAGLENVLPTDVLRPQVTSDGLGAFL